MSARESHYGKGHEPDGSAEGSRLADAAKLILLDEYGALLRTIEPVRMANRALLIAVVLLQVFDAPMAVLYQVLFLSVAASASAFWVVQEVVTGRRLGRLGELIASTSGELIAGLEADYSPRVVLPPLHRESRADFSETGGPSPQVASGQIWTDAYVSWRHEARNDRWLRSFQRLEPVIWFGLALVVGIRHALLVLH
jgi:hypothetical protein